MQRDGGPGGAGGAGNPVGGSFTGPAEALEILGDHAYAYSGRHGSQTSNVTHLEFTTGNFLFVGELCFMGTTKMGGLTGGDISDCQVSFNDLPLFVLKVDTATENMPTELVVPILIPPYTQVLVEVISSGSTADFDTSVNIIGRIYRG